MKTNLRKQFEIKVNNECGFKVMQQLFKSCVKNTTAFK